MLLTYTVLMNMIIAIVLEAFTIVKEETSSARVLWTDLYKGITSRVRSVWTRLSGTVQKKKKYVDLKILKQAIKASDKDFIEMEELKEYAISPPTSYPLRQI